MTIYLHDTFNNKKILFEPLAKDRVTMYLCGPTVYNYAHIGNARPAVVFDLLARLLRRSYKLTFVRNITDVDDKINAIAKESGEPIEKITERFIKAYNKDMAVLGVLPPDIEPRATQHLNDMIEMISNLIKKGFAYEVENHVLFDVSANSTYGQLSKRNLREMIAGSRVEVAPYKKSAHDFVLWKPSTSDLPGWNSPWGRGRPGWHIECSAMASKYLGHTIDIHAGGQDLVFPHHENELAQSTCAHGNSTFVRYWLHNGFLSINHEKMSKSLGNILLVHELIKNIPGEVIRLALLSAHYRQPLEWSDQTIESARRMLNRLYGSIRGIQISEDDRAAAQLPAAVMAALEDDLNTPKAMAEIFNLARALNKTQDETKRSRLAAEILVAGDLVGLLKNDPEKWFVASDEKAFPVSKIESLIAKRNEARAKKDFTTADAIRDELIANGVSIEDGSSGTQWRRIV
jgi:cysteinyl-tRNA synthetase